ncbi:MAG: 2-hydroxyacyl-CoA dehydratase, partial [Dehalococcoidia bacterium]
KVVGYLCKYVPEEIIYANGALTVRVLGSREPQDVSETHIFGMYCPFCRDCLAQGLQGKYNYLDGLVNALSCIHIRQTYDSWWRNLPLAYHYYMFMPAHVQSRHAQACLVGDMGEFRRSLEEWTGKPITEEGLWRAIQVYDTNRSLLRQLYELRKAPHPPISGAEVMEIVIASQLMDKGEHSRLLAELLQQLPQAGEGVRPAVRLMVLGSENDDTEFLRLVESLDATVVIDDHCCGSRYFWNTVAAADGSANGSPVEALAARYLSRPPCPQKDLVERRRFQHILQLAQDYQVQGVMFTHQKFCDPHEFDFPSLKALLEEQGIPTLMLEFDATLPGGQFRTRLEAFLEMLVLEIV